MLYLCWCFISDVGAEANFFTNILQRAVNNPEFIPRLFQQPVHSSAQVKSVFRGTAEERLQIIEKFMNSKIKQLIEDPGLLDELSMSMANYLSAQITVEDDMIKVSDILFEKVGNHHNYRVAQQLLFDSEHCDQGLVQTFMSYGP
jgi:hypothetical protein